jgi:hypothetical protein
MDHDPNVANLEDPLSSLVLNHWERKRRTLQRADNQDAMENFQQNPPTGDPVDDVITYWWSKQLDPYRKDLARMVLEYLSIPAMSVEPERVFSAAKLTLSDQRCRMGDDAINALECLKS